MVCSTCSMRNKCSEVCPEVEKLLPKEDDYRLNYGDKRVSEIERIYHEISATQTILNFRHHLKGKQLHIINLYYNHALSQVEIAKRLNISQSAVCIHLKRAYRKIWRIATGWRKLS